MKKKIFKSIFFTIIAVLICAGTIFLFCCYSAFRNVSGEAVDGTVLAAELAAPTAVILTVAFVVAFVVATCVSSNIVKPINKIDPENPEDTKTYEELKPIIAKLASQNYKVARQIEMLKKRENEFNSITFNMNEGIIVLNSRGTVLSCNRSAKNVFGIKGDEPKSVLAINSSQEFRDALSLALAGETGYATMRIEDKIYSLFATPVFRDRSVDGAVILLIDVTEKEARESLRREFTSNVSHELKTPLTSIIGFAEIIKSGIATADDAKQFADKIYSEASRLIRLVGDIIRLSRLDGGEIPYDDEKVNLRAVAEEVKERLEVQAQKAEVDLRLCAEDAFVTGNATVIEEMLYNLVDNAIKYNRRGGEVTISLTKGDDGVSLSVEDNGIGIPKGSRDRVFERFYRVDKSRSKAIGGTGLGLSIVKHAAAYHKAKINLVSEEGEGTTVTVIFPNADTSRNQAVIKR